MAGWSILANGSALDSVENNGACQRNGILGNNDRYDSREGADCDDSDGCNVKLRRLFDKVLSVFVRAIGENGIFRPVPAMLAYKQPVDLFKLFWVVKEKGGSDLVSKKRLWALVAKESGLGIGATAAVKLVYFKYLSELEQWLMGKCKDGIFGNGNFQMLSLELETEFRDLFSEEGGLVQLEYDKNVKNGKFSYMGIEKRKVGLSEAKRSGVRKCNTDNDEEVGNKDHSGDLVILDSSVDKKDKDFKRKRESLSGLLKWLTVIAKHSDDPSIGMLGGPYKLKEHEGKEFWDQAIRAREALLLRRHVDSNTEESLLQKKLKMHPSMYEDNTTPSPQSPERSRCRKRLPSVLKSRFCSCCNSCSSSPTKLKSTHKVELENETKEEAAVDVDLPALVKEVYPSEDEPVEKHVSVGPLFQADVPEWTGVVSESDSKWLGTRVWPLECREHKIPFETATVGKGRPKFCDCLLPGSVECVRFHIAEARMKLKLELGSVFYCWKFHHIGEEVSLQWTAEEETRFKDILRLTKPFADKKVKWFPRKTRENLVSYYFNAFLVQKRSYQNRVTPKNIDSDDDETEFGSVGDRFGSKAVNVSGSNFLSCIQNKQCTDLG